MTGTVHVDVDDHVLTLTIDNPEKRNALSPSFLPTIRDALREPPASVRVAVLTGAGEQAFSAGYDITQLRDRDPETDPTLFRQAVRAIAEFPYPTVARVNGDAVGGAFEFVTACDLRVAVEEARFGLTPAKLGLVYEAEGIRRVVDVVGGSNARELLFTADLVDAERAREMGLLNRLVPRADLDATTDDLVESIAGNAPLSLRGSKQIIDAVLSKRDLTDVEEEWAARLRRESAESRDHRHAVEAFERGETPEFEGR
ncbi:MAG: enoyl-CoA hydratase/isomerase family protein [Haloarculaceae archaeon]